MKKSVILIVALLVSLTLIATDVATNNTDSETIAKGKTEEIIKMISPDGEKIFSIQISLEQNEEQIKECKILTNLVIPNIINKGWEKAKEKTVSDILIIFIDKKNELQIMQLKSPQKRLHS